MNRSHRLITVFGNVLPKLSCLIRLLGSPCSRDTETVSRLIDIEPSHKDLQQGINAHLREFNNNKLAEPTSNTPKTYPQELLHNLRLLDAVPLQAPIPFLKLDPLNQFAPSRMRRSMQTPIRALARICQQPDRTRTRLRREIHQTDPETLDNTFGTFLLLARESLGEDICSALLYAVAKGLEADLRA